jgi:2-dehydro-3-deoxyglucarate aldolase
MSDRLSLRQALIQKKVTLCAWLQIAHPAGAEIHGLAGYDWICVDLEHGAIDLESMANIFRAIDSYGATPVARLPLNDPIWIHRSLDAGARGLIIPMVKTAEEAQAAIREAKYPPMGGRGYGYSRANVYGEIFEKSIVSANDEIAMIMQIEHKDAIANIDGILSVPGVDGVFIGPLDLSGSMGITGQLKHPMMVQALDTYRAACRKHNIAAGLHIVRPNPENIAEAIAAGYTLIALGLDVVFMAEGAKAALECARKATGK